MKKLTAWSTLSNKHKNYVISVVLVSLMALGYFVDNDYILNIFINIAFYSCMASAWNMMCGLTGYFSFGHVAFMGIGQYASTLLFVKTGVSPWLGMLLGVGISLLLAFLIGILSLRLKGFYFSLSTKALAIIISILIVRFEPFTGGATGVYIPFEPNFFTMVFQEYRSYYLLMLILLVVVLIVSSYSRESRLGYNLIAIKGNELAAASLGVDVVRSKLIALCMSAAFTSMAGTIMAQYTLFIDPVTAFNPATGEKIAIMTIIGGIGTVFGPLLGSAIMVPAEILLRGWIGNTIQGLYLFIYGAVLVVSILYMPGGFLNLAHRIKLRIQNGKNTNSDTKPKVNSRS